MERETQEKLTQWVLDSWLAGIETIEIVGRLRLGGFSDGTIKAAVAWIDELNQLTETRIRQ